MARRRCIDDNDDASVRIAFAMGLEDRKRELEEVRDILLGNTESRLKYVLKELAILNNPLEEGE